MPESLPPCEAALASLPCDVLAAISGGVDSMALLHALVATGRRPIVLHFNHGWREESAADAKWIRDCARRLRLKFVTARLHLEEPDRREASARAARFAFFARVAQKLGIADLVLAHHADDQVETFLLQLVRGAGSAGRGMEAVARRDGLVLHRPWLAIWKKEIASYARANKLNWRDDATNIDVRHRRNLIRRQLMPYLRRRFGTAVEENLWRAAEIARVEGEWLDSLCAPMVNDDFLEVKTLRTCPAAQQRRVIRTWLLARGVSDLSFEDVEAVRAFLERRVPAKVNLSRGIFARRRNGRIFIDR